MCALMLNIYSHYFSCTSRQAVSHLERATTERKYYKDACEESSKQIHALFTEDDIYSPPPPNSSHQPNPIHSRSVFITPSILPSRYIFRVIRFNLDRSIFLTPRKCGLFGVTCESIPRQVNFLIDEAVDMGKGQIPYAACYTTSLVITVWENRQYISMPTTALDRIRIILLYRYI